LPGSVYRQFQGKCRKPHPDGLLPDSKHRLPGSFYRKFQGKCRKFRSKYRVPG